MDYTAKMKYGTETVEIKVEGAKSVKVLNPDPMPEIEDVEEAFRACVEEKAIGSAPLKDKIASTDKVTIVVSDITRSWMHQGDILTYLGHYLHDTMNVPFENICVLIALGTHRKSEEKEKEIIAGSYLYENVEVIDHDCDEGNVLVGHTSRGTDVYVNSLVVGRKVIVVGGTVHHMMAGFGGGRKNILPGVSSRQTIRQNHQRALDPNVAHSDPRVGCALLENNPINEDMNEAAAMVDVTYGINIVVATSGKFSGLFGGDLYEAWKESCLFQKKCYEKWIDHEADIVIVSSGGAPKDMNLYQGCKGMMNGMRAMKENGQMLWLAKCPEGCGAPDYTAWLKPLKEGILDSALRADFTIGGFIFYLTVENLKKGQCRIHTTIDNDTTEPMGMKAYTELSDFVKGIDFTDKTVYIIPYGGSVVPMVKGVD
ncbi:MAG: nickel-dependent lactate racemase [Butyrivibrio sp.]|uniref:nickel-dependent lactate racemase n=1 Tax=Butyrivibrio sp. TaxID=28121 RepID=UPI0025D86CF5|nr:nickel-dependent lactate racemase [Butyrivibrio sp.]MCR5771726.1 nickel-dependent lactate racemase [Butyrivibrio sp.]